MKVIIASDVDQLSSFAAHFVTRQLQMNPALVLGLATGRTMVGFYRELVVRHRSGECSLARAATFNLDEYVNLAPDHPASFHAFMQHHLFDHVDIRPENVHIPDGNSDRLVEAAASYEAEIRRRGGIDLQMLGVGRNGHLAFNEPGSSLASRTRVKRLTPETILANASDFGSPEAVPRYVITTGIGTIMDAKFVLLLASGTSKARAVEALVEGPVTAQWPASVLQLHPHAFVVVDREAGCRLSGAYDTVEEVLADPYEEYFWEGA